MKYRIVERKLNTPQSIAQTPSVEGEVVNSAQRKARSAFKLRRWVAYIAILTFVLSGITYSRFISSTNGNDDARVAYFQVVATDTSATLNLAPGEDGKFKILLDSSKIEVAITCIITVEAASGINYTYKLRDHMALHDFTGNSIKLPVGAGSLMQYEVEVHAPAGLGAEFAGIVDALSVTVDIVQID